MSTKQNRYLKILFCLAFGLHTIHYLLQKLLASIDYGSEPSWVNLQMIAKIRDQILYVIYVDFVFACLLIYFLLSSPVKKFFRLGEEQIFSKANIHEPSHKVTKAEIAVARLRFWWIIIGIVTFLGVVAFTVDTNTPSPEDRLTGSNGSASAIFFATFAIVILLIIGARFSYTKFARINQADLLADKFGSQKHSELTGPPTVANFPSSDKYDQLAKLKNLLDSGAITQNEYEQEKSKVLSGS